MNKGLEAAKANRPKAVKWRAAVNAKCKECIYDHLSGLGTWREQVEGCPSHDCPLWPIRPKSRSGRAKNTQDGECGA